MYCSQNTTAESVEQTLHATAACEFLKRPQSIASPKHVELERNLHPPITPIRQICLTAALRHIPLRKPTEDDPAAQNVTLYDM